MMRAAEWNRFVDVSGVVKKIITEGVKNLEVMFFETPSTMNSL